VNEHDKIMEIIRLKDEAPLDFDARRSALLVIDMQRYFVGPDHPFAQALERLVPGSTEGYFRRVRERVVPNIRRLLEAFRAEGRHVVFTGTGTHTDDGRELPPWLKGFDQLGLALLGGRVWPHASDASWQIAEAVAPRAGEFVLHKTSSGPLASTGLEQLLHNLGVTSLVVAGLTTDVCVTQTARETADRGFRVVVAGDACTTLSEEMHAAALLAFSLAFGRVRKTEEVMALLGAGERATTAC
jgi:nicotinamidase-related amidase